VQETQKHKNRTLAMQWSMYFILLILLVLLLPSATGFNPLSIASFRTMLFSQLSDAEIDVLVQQRVHARLQRDYNQADEIKDKLENLSVGSSLFLP
jgi:cysteinyl-tRNA synthetase